MKTTTGLIKVILIILSLPLLFIGCAPPQPEIVWPKPPDKPRIKFVKSIHRGADLGAKSVAAEIILGAETAFTLRKPNSVYAGPDGKIYISDTAFGDVFIFDLKKKKATSLGAMGTRLLAKPIGVAVDSRGRIFVADSRSDRVAVFDREGQLLGFLKTKEPFKQPTGVALDEKRKRLYVVDTHKHHVQVFNSETLEYIRTIGHRGKEEGSFNFPSYITVDPEGFVYIMDSMNARVQIFSPEGKFIRSFGRFGDIPGEFARPKGIALDSEGHIYVVDAAFNNVQIFDREGRILLAFGEYGNGPGQMILPAGIAIDQDDFIYVADQWNERINVYEFLGKKHEERESGKKKKEG